MYNITVLRNAAENYCWEENDYRLFSLKYREAVRSGEYGKNRTRWEVDYWEKYRSANAAWEKLADMAALVGADWQQVLLVEKSIMRYNKHRAGWDFCPHFAACADAGGAESYYRTVAKV